MQISCVIIDDEQNAASSLKLLLNHHLPELVCKGIANDALNGIKLINQAKPTIVFLDINMPVHNGFEVLECTDNSTFYTVFTTAYPEHAIKAIKHKAFDYLLKPIDTDELCESILKIKTDIEKKLNSNGNTNDKSSTPLLSIPTSEGIVFLKQDEIIRIEGDGSYSAIFTDDKRRFVVSKNLKEIEQLLTLEDFFRAHKSHILHLKKVKKYIKTDGYFAEMTDGSVVEVARRKKESFLSFINGNF